MPSRIACSRKSGVVSITTQRPSNSTITEGRVRRSLGSAEWQTTQSQPSVGTPIDVPLPSTVKVAFMTALSLCRAAGSGRFRRRAARYGFGQLNVSHAQLEEDISQRFLFGVAQVALGLIA